MLDQRVVFEKNPADQDLERAGGRIYKRCRAHLQGRVTTQRGSG